MLFFYLERFCIRFRECYFPQCFASSFLCRRSFQAFVEGLRYSQDFVAIRNFEILAQSVFSEVSNLPVIQSLGKICLLKVTKLLPYFSRLVVIAIFRVHDNTRIER